MHQISTDNLDILSQKKLNHDFLMTNCNESNSWYTLIADIYCKSVSLRGVKLTKNSIDYVFSLCSKSSDDQTLLRASKVLKICFKDRSVISYFRNEPESLLTQVKILMEKHENIQNIYNSFSIVFVNLALVMSEISQENLESTTRIYDLDLAIQESLPKTEDEYDGNYLNEKAFELLEKAGGNVRLTQPVEDFFNSALTALSNYTEQNEQPKIFTKILALLERILENATTIPPRTLKAIEDLACDCENSNVLSILKLIVKSGQEISIDLLRIFSSYINDPEDDENEAKHYTYMEILNHADANQDLPEDIFQVMEIANASSHLRSVASQDQTKIAILKFVLSKTSIDSRLNFPKRTLQEMGNILTKEKEALSDSKELVDVMLDVAIELSENGRNLSAEFLENFQKYANNIDCPKTQSRLFDVYENLLKNSFKLPALCSQIFGMDRDHENLEMLVFPTVNRNEKKKGEQSRNILLREIMLVEKGTRSLDESELISKIETNANLFDHEFLNRLLSVYSGLQRDPCNQIANMLIRIADKINDKSVKSGISLFCEIHNLNMGKIGNDFRIQRSLEYIQNHIQTSERENLFFFGIFYYVNLFLKQKSVDEAHYKLFDDLTNMISEQSEMNRQQLDRDHMKFFKNFKLAPTAIKHLLSFLQRKQSSRKFYDLLLSLELVDLRLTSIEESWERNVGQATRDSLHSKLEKYYTSEEICKIISLNVMVLECDQLELLVKKHLRDQATSTHFWDVMMLLREFKLNYNLQMKGHFNALKDLMNNNPPESWIKCVNNLLVKLKYSSKLCVREKSMEKILVEFKQKNASLVLDDELFKAIENDIMTIKKKNLKSNLCSDEAKPISKWEKDDILKFSTKMMSMRRQQNERQTFVIECLAVVNRAMQLEGGGRIELRDTQLLASLFVLKYSNTSMLMQMSTGEGKTIVLNILSICVLLLGRAKQVYNFTSSPDLAKRDVKQNKKLFAMFDLTVSENSDKRGGYIEGPKKCYSSKIVYGEGSQFLFDTLRHKYSGLNTFG
jgi:hypothetical protein